MDHEDIDTYRRNTNAAATTDGTKAFNEQALKASGLQFSIADNGDTYVNRQHGQPTVKFYLRRSRWQVSGERRTRFGSVASFIDFLKKLRGVQ